MAKNRQLQNYQLYNKIDSWLTEGQRDRPTLMLPVGLTRVWVLV